MPIMPDVRRDGERLYALETAAAPVYAHLSKTLFEETDENVWSQAADAALVPGVEEVHLMPDVHAGAGFPVGCVLVTADTLVLAASGYDISCGMVAVRFPSLSAAHIADPTLRRAWIDAVEARVPTGIGSKTTPLGRVYTESEVEEVLRHGAQALGINSGYCERPAFQIPDGWDSWAVPLARSRAAVQLGSLGGGNHFIELLCDEETAGVWVMVHTGSRGYGWRMADRFFRAAAELRGLPVKERERAWLGEDEPLGREYIVAHNSAANYATANRWAIVEAVRHATGDVFGADGEPYYEISHNLVQRETWGGENGKREMLVHRKGATRALPPMHPNLSDHYNSNETHPILVPGSMLVGAAILRPLPGAWGWACSVNHGTGRTMGRKQAIRELGSEQKTIDAEMRDIVREFGGVPVMGVLSNHRQIPLDECGRVYKGIDDVIGTIVDDGAATVLHRLWPVANVKGVD